MAAKLKNQSAPGNARGSVSATRVGPGAVTLEERSTRDWAHERGDADVWGKHHNGQGTTWKDTPQSGQLGPQGRGSNGGTPK